MPKITLDTTIQFKRNTYKMGDIVEISVEDVDIFSRYGKIIEEEEQLKEEVVEQPKKSTRKSAKR